MCTVDEALGRVDVPLKELIRGAARARAPAPRPGFRVSSRGMSRSRSAALRSRTPVRRAPPSGAPGRTALSSPSPQKPSRGQYAYPGLVPNPARNPNPTNGYSTPPASSALARSAPRLTAALDAAVACVSPFAAAAPAGGAAPASLMHASSRPLGSCKGSPSLCLGVGGGALGNGGSPGAGNGAEADEEEEGDKEVEEEEADGSDVLAGGGWILPQLADGLARLGSTDVCVPSHQDHRTGAQPSKV